MGRALAGIRVVGACIVGVRVVGMYVRRLRTSQSQRACEGRVGWTDRAICEQWGERGEATERESVGPLPYVLHRREPTG